MKKSIVFMAFLISTIFISGCSDDDNSDTSPPEINFVSPSANAVFDLDALSAEGITIELDITDNVRIGNVSIEIKDATNEIVYTFVDTEVFASNLTNYHIIEHFKPNASGTYFIQCFAGDTSFNNSISEVVTINFE